MKLLYHFKALFSAMILNELLFSILHFLGNLIYGASSIRDFLGNFAIFNKNSFNISSCIKHFNLQFYETLLSFSETILWNILIFLRNKLFAAKMRKKKKKKQKRICHVFKIVAKFHVKFNVWWAINNKQNYKNSWEIV